uniref:Uncharacterized protein n=1 Tax=Romanomermis culicivorax TaxID=13658 RepID=A0A915J4U7_ROMCU
MFQAELSEMAWQKRMMQQERNEYKARQLGAKSESKKAAPLFLLSDMALDMDMDIGYGTPILGHNGIRGPQKAAQRWKELSGQETPENGDSSKWKMSGAELDYYDYY